MKNVVKRDGRVVSFNAEKIENAIFKAMQSQNINNFELAKAQADKVIKKIDALKDMPTVEQIQDIVEEVLMQSGFSSVAKSYIIYRNNRNKQREMNSSLMKTFDEINSKSAKDSDIKKENANINGDTPMGVMLKFGTEASKDYFHKFVLEDEFSALHKNGDIHIHDLDFYSLTTTCCQIDLKKLFKNGFSTGHGFLREPNDISVYSALACIAIQSNQNDQHGGQSIPNFDYAMADGVKKTFKKNYYNNFIKTLEILGYETSKVLENFKILENEKALYPTLDKNVAFDKAEEKMFSFLMKEDFLKVKDLALKYANAETDRACFQAMEALVHNLNTMHSRAGAQVPFSSLNFGTDTSSEGRMVIKNFLLATEKGLGYGETPIFPISIFKLKEGINYNKEDKNYDLFRLALRVSSKRLFPNFSFIDAPFNLQYYKPNKPETEIAYMGCRTRVISNVFDKDNEVVYGRGNLSFTSINLPRIALDSKNNSLEFYRILETKLQAVVKQLKHRFKIQGQKTVKNYPFLMGQGVWIGSDKLKLDDKIEQVLKNGTLSVGFIGLAEALKALTGFHHGESENSQKLGLEIIGFMRTYLDKLATKEKLNFSLIATPAEGLSGRFVNIDREKYGVIEGVTDKEYYTNSFHIPVYFNISAFDKISKEAPYHALTNAGHITYVELDGDVSLNLNALEKIVRHMKESGVGYGSINHPVDRDPVCGYIGVIGEVCPKCLRNENEIGFERIRRITGYLVGTLDRFNKAKFAEVRDRLKHNV